MIVAKLVAVSLIVGVATGPAVEPAEPLVRQLSLHRKNAAMLPYQRHATQCIVRAVAADTRFQRAAPETNLGDLIVESMPKCVAPVRAMIEAYDRYFGDGAGEAFFMGPYLDVLPTAVVKLAPGMTD
jgi:hypothetical protein